MESTKKPALLVMDLPNVILQHVTDPTEIISKVSSAIAEARAKTIPVIYVVVNFRPGAPEISELNKNFSRFGDKAMWTPEFCAQWGQIHPDLSPQEGDIVVTKRRFSAFTGSDLEVVLRGQGIQHLVLTGISTSGVVLSTLREAADKDFQLTVIKDCCADRDPEVHQVLMDKIFPVQVEVVSLGAWLS